MANGKLKPVRTQSASPDAITTVNLCQNMVIKIRNNVVNTVKSKSGRALVFPW